MSVIRQKFLKMVDIKELQKVVQPEPPVGYTEGALLRKYGIPVAHLDFDYVEKCTNARELEKIYHILVSGEEGHFPQLLEMTEEKLKKLKPNSRYIRKETPMLKKECLNKDELNDLNSDLQEWLKEVTISSQELDANKTTCTKKDAPAVRLTKTMKMSNNKKDNPQRIKSTDYASWDKYDPDTEILKLDLEEEKLKTDVKKKEFAKPKEKKVQISEFATRAEAAFEANREKEKGNEYFKACDYGEALKHYITALKYFPSATLFTNKAITLLKLTKYEEARQDCLSALRYEPNNVKAHFRLALSFEGLNDYEKALACIENVIKLDPNNEPAQKLAESLQNKLGRPIKNTRMKIVDIQGNAVNPEFTKKKSILKKTLSDNTTVIPIPGPSSMRPPYFVTINSTYSKDILAAQKEVSYLHRKVLCMPVIDREPDDDSDPIIFCNENTSNVKIYPARSRISKKRNRLNSATNTAFDKKKESATVQKENKNLVNENKMDDKNIQIKESLPDVCESVNKLTFKENDVNVIASKNEDVKKSNGICANSYNINTTCNEEIRETKLTPVKGISKNDKGGGGEPCVQQEPPDLASTEELHLPFTFLRSWNSASRDTTYNQQAEILRRLDLNRLGEVIGNKLDSTMLSNILQCLHQHFAVASEIDKVYAALSSLSNVPRMSIMIMLMSRSDRKCVQNLIDFLTQHDRSLPNDIKKVYCS